ncbi:acetyl-CoA acetyltransferase [Elusimicrobiota bacterium]
MRKVAIIGIGVTKAQAKTPNLSYKELTYGAAKLAYKDAGIKAEEIQSFVTCAEDFNEGTSIFDEYTPDQLGAATKPMHTLTQDSLVGIADAYMQIASGLFDLVVVEAHSKASNINNINNVEGYALDPNWVRPLDIPAKALAALEANKYLQKTQVSREDMERVLFKVVEKNKSNAKLNPLAAYPGKVTLKQYLKSSSDYTPIRHIEEAAHSDGACVIVMASEEYLSKSNNRKPIWVRGIGWASETSEIGSRSWTKATYAKLAADKAYKMAGIRDPKEEIDVFEIDDTFSYKELQHMEAIGLCSTREANEMTLNGETSNKGSMPVNTSGGFLGMGDLLEAKGLYQVTELVAQLKGKAGKRQVKGAKKGLALSWRGVPTTSGACVILSN